MLVLSCCGLRGRVSAALRLAGACGHRTPHRLFFPKSATAKNHPADDNHGKKSKETPHRRFAPHKGKCKGAQGFSSKPWYVLSCTGKRWAKSLFLTVSSSTVSHFVLVLLLPKSHLLLRQGRSQPTNSSFTAKVFQ